LTASSLIEQKSAGKLELIKILTSIKKPGKEHQWLQGNTVEDISMKIDNNLLLRLQTV